MVSYILTARTYSTLTGRGYRLVCKICGCPLQTGDCVESKPSKYRRRKFYHCKCYEDAFLEIENGDNGDDEEAESE